MRKLGIILSSLSIISLYNCSDINKQVKIIDLQSFSKNKTVVLEDRYNKYFTEYNAVFLEKTENFSYKDVKQVVSVKNDIFILIKNHIRRYNLITGCLVNSFKVQNSIHDFISFDIDTVNKTIYALDTKYTKIVSLDTLGNTLDVFTLDPIYEYDQLILLDKSHLMVSTFSLPMPVTFIVDIGGKSINLIDFPSKKTFKPDNQFYDAIDNKNALLNICTRCDIGVLVKYMFDDIIYRYKNDGKEPVFKVKIIQTRKPKLNKKNISSKIGTIMLSGLWQLSEDKWLVRWSQEMVYKGSLTSIQILTICNDEMRIFNESPSYNTTIMEWYKPGTIFGIGAYDLIFVNSKEKKLFKVMSSNLSGVNLPEYLNTCQTQNNLILCYYSIK